MAEKQIRNLSVTLFLATVFQCSFGQLPAAPPQTFDHFTFVIPSGYSVKKGKTFIDFLRYNAAKTGYIEITFYRAQPGSNDLKAEFEKEWNVLVKKKTNVAAPIGATSEVENGWVSTFGSALINAPEGKYLQSLITFVGNNLVATISVRVTDDSFAKEVESILESIEVEKPTTVVK